MSFQIGVAVAVVLCAASLAAVTATSKQNPVRAINVSRSNLWEAEPVRIDRQRPLLTITVSTPAKTDGQTASPLCSDAIGLRIACDLVAANRRPS